MKKSLTGMLALLAGAYAVHAQGTVSMGNYSSLPYAQYIYVSYKGTPLGGANTGPTPTLSNFALEVGNGNDWTVQLYGALGSQLPASSLLPLAVTATFANGLVDGLAGTWYSAGSPDQIGPTGTLAGSIATVQLYAWYNAGGVITSYAQALADGVPAGYSGLDSVSLGGPNASGPPSTAASLPALGNFVLTVPEPSTVALGVVGASTFLMRLRRKK